jgi:hypothetical protein
MVVSERDNDESHLSAFHAFQTLFNGVCHSFVGLGRAHQKHFSKLDLRPLGKLNALILQKCFSRFFIGGHDQEVG